ncbi:MAG: hypothetical protein LBH00_11440 [Planctomycetaceae bacterium]|jgi:hypothetical protein|nr:hypothetical protein [Planctomycetaceae bacterium]
MKHVYSVLLAFLLPAATFAEEGLLGHWTFDDDPAGKIRNAANPQFDAETAQDLPRTKGVHGNAAELNGKHALKVPANILPSGIKELTFSAWVLPKHLNGYIQILRKEDVGRNSRRQGGENRLLFGFQENGRFLTLGLNCGGNYAECDAVIIPEEILDGQWHFVAGTFDGQTMRVYLDGEEIGSRKRQGLLSTGADYRPLIRSRDDLVNGRITGNFLSVDEALQQATVNDPLFIGSLKGESEFFEGKLDDVKFYSKALNAGEIKSAFAAAGSKIPAHAKSLVPQSCYVKADTFTNTLLETAKRMIPRQKTEPVTMAALHRMILRDFPAETSDYIAKMNRSPVETMTWSTGKLLERGKQLAVQYTEYMPQTDMQWKVQTDQDRAKWNRVKDLFASFKQAEEKPESADPIKLFEVILDMENTVEDRPRDSESVAGYVVPQTPEVKDRSPEEAQQIIEADWLFQCDNKPTVDRAKQEINWAKALAGRISKQYPGKVDFGSELKQLAELETKANGRNGGEEDRELYFAVRKVKREITFKNPVLDFDSILYVDGPLPGGSERDHETRHQLGYMAVPGGRLMTLKGLKPDGHQIKLMPQTLSDNTVLHGSFWRPDVSYDGKRVLASFKPHNEKTFHLYEIDLERGLQQRGGNLKDDYIRQLTAGIFDDLDPVYLPDGRNIMFLTTRGHIYVRCMPPTNAMVMARMPLDTKPGDKNLYIISRNGEPEYTPSVMNDGRVIYTRWEYTDKPLWRCQSLWTMNSDGTQVQTFWGNQSVWPDLLKDARAIPGSERIMFTGSAHHNWYSGSVGMIDPGKGFNFPDGLTKVTQEVGWPECGNGPTDPKESASYHTAGQYRAYYSPYPLSETDFLVSANRGKWVLLFMDTDGNRELVFEGNHHIFDAQPIRPRPVPPVAADRVSWPSWEERNNPGTGTIYSNNVYENAPPELKGKAKYLRIWSIEHKTYTYWTKRTLVSSGPEISVNQSEGIKKIIGTVPVEEDGSVSFTAPTGIALHFQLLDENGLALQTMKSFTGVLPGETRGCLGCHESMTRTPVTAQTGKALKRPPSDIQPVAWEDITVGYERYVQPVLDKYCGKCHQDPKHDAFKKFNATLRPGFLGFKEPYLTLMGTPSWGTRYREMPRGKEIGGYGWADTILVESFDQRDPAAYATYPAMTRLSYKSRLVKRMMSGEHHGVKVTGNDLLRVILWVDAMGPYYGAEEVRCMEDPIFQGVNWISQRPRVMTAPIVQRPGPFDPFFTDSAYDAPKKEQYNALPVGVMRKK